MSKLNIDFAKVALRILNILIINVFTLPFKIYKNTLINLSSSDDKKSTESTLSGDFPIYVWFIGLYDAIIALTYPIGLIGALLAGADEGFGMFLGAVIVTYFAPLYIGFIKELFSLTLKILQYLKINADK